MKSKEKPVNLKESTNFILGFKKKLHAISELAEAFQKFAASK
ncbi:hypothetical protein [Flavobacterium sp. DSR3-2]